MNKSLVICTLIAFFLAGCAAEVKRIPSSLAGVQPDVALARLRITKDITVTLDTGYSSTLKKDSTWDLVGTVPQGYVYKSNDQVLTVEGAHVHEAYIVVSGKSLVGFYLPVEKAFSPISSNTALPIE